MKTNETKTAKGAEQPGAGKPPGKPGLVPAQPDRLGSKSVKTRQAGLAKPAAAGKTKASDAPGNPAIQPTAAGPAGPSGKGSPPAATKETKLLAPPAGARPKLLAPPSAGIDVSFVLHEPNAARVTVCGEFNGWAPDATPMNRLDHGHWETTVTLTPGRYEYKFLVDGRWIHDFSARENVVNGHGTLNSVIEARN
jgi:hypothetical protein